MSNIHHLLILVHMLFMLLEFVFYPYVRKNVKGVNVSLSCLICGNYWNKRL